MVFRILDKLLVTSGKYLIQSTSDLNLGFLFGILLSISVSQTKLLKHWAKSSTRTEYQIRKIKKRKEKYIR